MQAKWDRHVLPRHDTCLMTNGNFPQTRSCTPARTPRRSCYRSCKPLLRPRPPPREVKVRGVLRVCFSEPAPVHLPRCKEGHICIYPYLYNAEKQADLDAGKSAPAKIDGSSSVGVAITIRQVQGAGCWQTSLTLSLLSIIHWMLKSDLIIHSDQWTA